MSTIEDKLLDGPRIHYCDADDDDIRPGHPDESAREESREASSVFIRPDEESERLARLGQVNLRCSGSTNTGPKGVIEDFKKRILSEDVSQENNGASVDQLEAEFRELLNDDTILQEYRDRRISAALRAVVPTFGHVYRLQNGPQLLDAIDKENQNVLVMVHLYTNYSRACSNLNRCLNELAQQFKHVKFVTLDASVTNLSGNFKENGVPALLAYRGGNLVKSLVQLEELLDRDFDAQQVKELLIDNDLMSH